MQELQSHSDIMDDSKNIQFNLVNKPENSKNSCINISVLFLLLDFKIYFDKLWQFGVP